MKRYKLRCLPLFSEDLNNIAHYISVVLRSPAATRCLMNDMEAAVQECSNMAGSFAPFPSTRIREHPYYPIYMCNLIVLYAVSDDMMEVRHTLYNRHNIGAILQ